MGNTESVPADKDSTCECGKPIEQSCKYNPKLVGTVKKLYRKHIVLCTGEFDWPEKISKDKDSFAGKISAILKQYETGNDDELIMLTASSEKSASPDTMDIIVYPEAVRYVGVKESELETCVKHILQPATQHSLTIQPVSYKHFIMVCTHNSRDKRCGRIGPQVVDSLIEILEAKGVDEKDVAVRGCSHLGGHKYAGVVVVYPEGDWYGQLSGKNTEQLVEAYLEKGTIYHEKFRGKMGETVAQSKQRLVGAGVVTPTSSSSNLFEDKNKNNNNNNNNNSNSSSTATAPTQTDTSKKE